MNTSVATFLKQLPRWNGNAALYKLSSPLKDFSTEKEYIYVVVSAVSFFCVETYIFGANENGEILDWGELPGSQKHTLSHEKVLKNAGYTLNTL